MKKLLLALISFSLAFSCLLRAAEPPDPLVYIKTDANDIPRIYTHNPIFLGLHDKEVARLTPAERDELRPHLLREMNSGEQAGRMLGAGVLLALGDDESIKAVVGASHAGNEEASSAIDYNSNEALLPYLVDDVLNGSMAGHGPAARASDRSEATWKVFSILVKSKLFPPATRAWAKQISESDEFVTDDLAHWSLTAKFRVWWEHNKDAILAKDYAKATWLPTAADQTPPVTSASPQNPASVSPPPAPAPSESTPALKWLLLAAVTLAALAVGWRLRRRK